MKNKLRYLFAALLVTALITCSAVSVSAEENLDTPPYVDVAEERREATEVDVTKDLAGTTETENAEEILTDGEVGEDSESQINLFTKLYEDVMAYASEILCALTLAGSVSLAIAYKKGLLPLIERSLVTIGNAITKIRDNAKESADKNNEITGCIDEKLSAAKKTLEDLTEKIEVLDKMLSGNLRDESEARREKKQLYLILNAQIEMLYDIFMSSALPQYQKDAVGEKIAKMREAVRENAYEV